MRTKTCAVIAALALLIVTAPACSRGGDASKAPFVPVDPNSASATDRAIAKAQARLKSSPDDPTAKLDLAQGFLQKARETADPSLYTKAGELLDDLDKTQTDNPPVLITEGNLALAQHRFTDALKLGNRAVQVAPGNQAAIGVTVDAHNELGQYDAALAATQEMVNTRPDLPSLSRASYARELRGDYPGAILAMTQAVTAGQGAVGEGLAYVQALLGNLLVTQNRLAEAKQTYTDSDRSFPGFRAAKAGQARVLVAEERYSEAADLLAPVVEDQPLVEYATARGDALTAAGRTKEATEAYALVDAISKLYRDNGVNDDLELAVFDADHNPGPDAVKRARRALDKRPSVFAHDALAWNLYRNGQLDEAAGQSALALQLGSQDPLFRYHAAAIADAQGDAAAAKDNMQVVIETQPRFSAYLTEDVKKLAAKYGLTVPPPTATP